MIQMEPEKNLSSIAGPNSLQNRFGIGSICMVIFLTAMVSIFTILSNLLVITAFIVERNIRHASNYFIASLAITDMLIGIVSMNLYSTYLVLGYWPFQEFICDLWLSIDYTACLTSQYTVFFITVDRFCSVQIPAKYRVWRTDRKVEFMVALTWIVPSVIFFTTIFGWPYFTKSRIRKSTECFVEFTAYPIFNTILTVSYFWVTLFVMCGLYGGVYQAAWTLQRKFKARHKNVSALMAMATHTMSHIGVEMTMKSLNPDAPPVPVRRKKAAILGGKLTSIPSISVSNSNYDTAKRHSFNDKKILSNLSTTSPNDLWQLKYIDEEENTEFGGRPQTFPLLKESTSFLSSSHIKRGNCLNVPSYSESSLLITTQITETAADQTRKSSIKSSSSQRGSTSMMFSLKEAANKLRQKRFSSSAERVENRQENRARKALKTISLILGAFVVCWTPYHIIVLIKSYCDEFEIRRSCVNGNLYSISYWLCYLNSPINPFCYALANAQFKTTFARILRGDFRRN